MGRPTPTPDQVKHSIPVRLTESSTRSLDDAAAVLGMSRSGFMRQAEDRVVKRTARNARLTELAA